MLSRRFKAKFDATSIDEFVGEFKKTMPGYPCPSTPTVYRYIDQGLVDMIRLWSSKDAGTSVITAMAVTLWSSYQDSWLSGKSMKDKSKAYVQQATDAINHKYRRILQYQTAEELFKQYISS